MRHNKSYPRAPSFRIPSAHANLAVARLGLAIRYQVSRWTATLVSRISPISILSLQYFFFHPPSFLFIPPLLTVYAFRDLIRFFLHPLWSN